MGVDLGLGEGESAQADHTPKRLLKGATNVEGHRTSLGEATDEHFFGVASIQSDFFFENPCDYV